MSFALKSLDRTDHFGEKLVDLFRAAAGERRRIDGRTEVDGGERFILLQAVHEVVLAALLLDDARGGLAMLTD